MLGLPGMVLNIILQIAGFKGGVCNQLAEKTGSLGTVSFDSCKVSGSAYCVAPTRYSYVVTWSDPDEDYRIDPERPATFHFRVVEGEVPYVDTLKALEEGAESIKIGEEQDDKQRERRESICTDTWNNAKDLFPKLIGGCLQQYVSTALHCAGVEGNVKAYILTGIPPELQDTCQNCVDDCPEECKVEEDPGERMEGICRRLDEKQDTVPEIPGVFRNAKSILPAKVPVSLENLSGETIDCLKRKGVHIPDDAEEVYVRASEVRECFTDNEKELYANAVADLWEERTKDDAWYCDPYTESVWNDIPGAGFIKEKLGGVFDSIAKKLSGIVDEACRAAGLERIADITNTACGDKESIKDAAKAVAFNPMLALACTSNAEFGKWSAKALVAEYNHIYHTHIAHLIGQIGNNGWGECNPD
ncbi:TPA: hypothetical protein EYP13_04400, partial [Candidatus Micrarchaeota archaeon]|nr:hypothetical protein [Candidatus Micrarchaeota archaeon]